MGQYFKVVAVDSISNDNFTTLDDDNCKFLEFAYLDCSDIVFRYLYENPMKLVVVGDYFDEEDYENFTHEELNKYYNSYCKTNYDVKEFDYSNCFIINHSTQEFINIQEYKKLIMSLRKNESEELIINPLFCLCSTSQGGAGGDYKDSINENLISKWLGNICEISAKNYNYKDVTKNCLFEL